MKSNHADMAPRPLYVYRAVKNASDIAAWAKSQGFTDVTPNDDMHVTVAYSKSPVNWFDMGESWGADITINEGGARIIDSFDGGTIVLRFTSEELSYRNAAMREAGASHDFNEYSPHITISHGDVPDNVEPYRGKIILGPEIFEDVKSEMPVITSDSGCGVFFDYSPVTNYEETKDGYLLVHADRVARTGVMTYYGRENDDYAKIARKLGISDNDPIRIYRDPVDVFADRAVNGWAHLPVTINHPKEQVTPDNYKEYAVGEISTDATISDDGKWFGLRFLVKDAAAIADVRAGLYPETSAGYSADIVIEGGVTADGVPYDAKQVNINPNHLAFVPRGRAFSDHATDVNKRGAAPLTMEGQEMDLIKIMVGDKAVQVAASDADIITALQKDHAEEIATRDAAIGEHMAKIANLEAAQLTDADIEAKAEERAAVLDKAAKFIDGFDGKGKTTEAIKRDVLAITYADKAAGFPVAAVDAMFEVLEPAKKNDTMRAALGDVKSATTGGAWDFLNKKEAK